MICGMWLRVKYFNTFIVIICINILGFKKKIDALAKKRIVKKCQSGHAVWLITCTGLLHLVMVIKRK